VVDLFIRRHLHGLNRTPGYQQLVASLLRRLVVKRWKGRDIGSITRPEIRAMLYEVKDESTRKGGKGVQANRVLMHLNTLFNFAADEGLVETNPCLRMKRVVREEPRDRELSDTELAAVWWSAERAFGYPWQQFVRMHILTGQRLREVAGMRWEDVDLEAATWTQRKNKSRRPHVVPLSGEALNVLASCRKSGSYVFTSGINGNAPIRGFAKPKLRLDARCGVKDWWQEDLRQTCASGMGRLKVAPHVIAAVLNHAPQKVTERHYNRYSYLDEKREALDDWAKHVIAIAERHPLPLTLEEARAEELRQSAKANPPPGPRAKSLAEAKAALGG
jgi:integrase